MGRTRILIPSSGDIEMYDDVSTPLNFSIADIREPDKRNSSYSKTIKIPNTKNNALLFGNIFNVNITDGTFNPNAKVLCQLIIDDEEQISGYIQMLNIIINDDSKIEYEISILGDVGNIFNALGNSELTDLDFSAYDHPYDYATQVASYTNDWGDGYCYPLIDYGFDGDTSKFNVEHLFPSIFLKSYIKKIFEASGFTYESTFLDSAFFENLIVPTNSGKVVLTDAQISTRLFEATQTVQSSGTISSAYSGIGTIYHTSFTTMDIVYNNEISDVSGQYNNATGEWTVLTSGYYNLGANGTATLTFSSGTTPMNSFLTIKHFPFGGIAYASIFQTAQLLSAGANTFYVGGSNIFLNAGDKIKVEISSSTVVNTFSSLGTITFNGGTFKNTVVNSGLIEGDTISVNQVIPNKTKQKDFFKSVVKAFNLYIDVDKDNDRNLLIETRDTFYADGTNLDWDSKLDNSKPIEYRPMGDLDFKEFLYNYTDDTDFFNKKYKDTYQETYGRYRYVTENEFMSATSETKIIFSPTPLVGDNASDRVISRIWDVDASNTVKSKAFNIRLLYRGGVKTSNVAFEHIGRVSGLHLTTQYLYAGHVDNPVSPTLDLCFGVPQEIYYNTSYYTNNNLFNAYHKRFIDEISDRDSKIVTAYFYLRPSDIRTLDFRNQFWFDNAYFRLNKIYDYDPLKNEVTKCEFIKIKEHGSFDAVVQPLLGGVGAAIGLEVSPFVGGGAYDVKDNVYQSGAARSMQTGEDNILNDNLRGAIIQGDGNVIGDSYNVALLGSSGNIIGSGSHNISIINSSGDIIDGGLKNVTLINSSDIEVGSGDILFINNIAMPTLFQPYAPIRSVSGASYNMKVFDGTILVTTGASNTTINLTLGAAQFATQWVQYELLGFPITQYLTKVFNIKKIDSGVGSVVITPPSGTIDGAATFSFNTQYQNMTIQYDGTNWHII
jgi:hypothetical protein